jgi:predicted dinucleotide-binding enzyme
VKAGRLRMARQLEPLTAVLISINKAYKTRSGVAISGVHG